MVTTWCAGWRSVAMGINGLRIFVREIDMDLSGPSLEEPYNVYVTQNSTLKKCNSRIEYQAEDVRGFQKGERGIST